MASTREAFLSDICATPEDDIPRLIFADWLDDNGEEERAHYIREQVAGRVCKVTTARFREWFSPWLDVGRFKLNHQNGATSAFAPGPAGSGTQIVIPTSKLIVRRGFPQVVRCILGTWLACGKGMIARGWPLQRVNITDRKAFLNSWWLQTDDNYVSRVPVPIFSLLEIAPLQSTLTGPIPSRKYSSETDARIALSDACLRWAGVTVAPRFGGVIDPNQKVVAYP